MDSHVVHSRVEGEGEDHHEKKSVLKKVKAKAKKLKETITGNHHGREHEGGDYAPGEHDLDEEDDDEEDDNPEVHGAPIYDSGASKTDAPKQGDILKVPTVKFGDTKAGRAESDPAVPKEKSNVSVGDPITSSNVPGLHGTTGHGAMNHSAGTRRTDAPMQGGKSNVGYSGPVSDFVPEQSRTTTTSTTTGNDDLLRGARTKTAGPTGPGLKHEEQPKGVSDVTGVGPPTPQNTPVSPLPHHGNYNIIPMDVEPSRTHVSGHERNPGQTGVKLGKTDVLGEETPMPQSTFASSLPQEAHRSTMDTDPFVAKQGGHRHERSEEDPHAPEDNPQAYASSNYETKVTDPTKSGGEAIGVAPILHSFDEMNLHGDDRQYLNNSVNKHDKSTGSHEQFSPEPTNQGSSYTEKISSATSAIADKAISVKNVVASKLGYGGNDPEHDDNGTSPRQHQNKVLDPSTNQFKAVGTPQVRGTIRPDVDDTGTATDQKPVQTGGSYTERISYAGSTIADKAMSAKNVVASKLGYGATDQTHDGGDVTRAGSTTTTDQQGKGITSTVAEKLSPVYGKVVGAGSAVMSKFQGGGTGNTGRDTSPGVANQAGQDKGASVKDYFVEKLRPGEEDRALSGVISETLQKRKPGAKEGTSHYDSDKPMGKVTESEERQNLGETRNDNFVKEKIRDTVT